MRYVIIGNSAAGIAAAKAILDRDDKGNVLILSDEPYPAYYRPLLPTFIQSWIDRDALFWDRSLLPKAEVSFRQGRVEQIQTCPKAVILRNGESIPYDRLLLATGASAVWPPIRGLVGPGVFSLRTLADADGIIAASQECRNVVIVGGGRIGMKTAMALYRRNLSVVVVEQGERVVPLQLDYEAAAMVSVALEALGIRLVLGQTVEEVARQNGRVAGVVTSDGRTLAAEAIVIAAGIRPNAKLATDAGLEVGLGIQTNPQLQTSDPDIYTAGDVAETHDMITGKAIVPGTWTEATSMGRLAGINMSGGNVEYPGSLAVQNSFQVAGIPSVSVGHIDPDPADGCDVYSRRRGDAYRKLVLRDGRLVGALLVGDIDAAGVYTGLVKQQKEIGSHLDDLLYRKPSFAPWLARSLVSQP